jgi:hypothetical protein
VNAARWPFIFRRPPDLSESVMALWRILRDVLLTGTGLAIIIKQALLTAHPSTEGLIAGLALTGIGASFHIGALLSGHIGGPSSASPPPPGSLPSGHSPEGETK